MSTSQKITEDYIIIWLDSNLDFSAAENQELISQFRRIRTFSNLDQCTDFIQQIKTEKIFLIISDCFTAHIASLEKQYPQLYSIYIFCDKQSKYDNQQSQAYKKGRGIFTEMKSLCMQLRKEIRQLDNDFVSISIISASVNNLNELDPIFMYFQLFKENLLTIQFNHEMGIQQFVDYCRSEYKKDEEKMKTINDLEKKYRERNPIWWYTLDSFLYKMLNQALREFKIDLLIKMGFFIQDLHEQIKQRYLQLHAGKQSFKVYRGQGILNTDFDKLVKIPKNGFLSFNSFLSTSMNESTAQDFACSNQCDPGKKAILFEIEIDTSKSSVPFTAIKDLSAIPTEDEILFSMSTVFRIGEIKQIEKNVWKVNLSLTNDRDPLLIRLTEHMRSSLGSGNGWRRMGQLMIKIGQFDKALELYKILWKKSGSR